MKKSGYTNSKQSDQVDYEIPDVSPALIESFNELSHDQEHELIFQAIARQIAYCSSIKASGKILTDDEFASKSLEIFAETADDFINTIQKNGGR